jgi:hypothetical protein
VFERPQQLGACQAPEHPGQGGIDAVFRQPAARQFALKYPESDERADSHHHAEGGDLELADAEERGVHKGLLASILTKTSANLRKSSGIDELAYRKLSFIPPTH